MPAADQADGHRRHRPGAGRHRDARPGPRRRHRHRARRADQPHRDHRRAAEPALRGPGGRRACSSPTTTSSPSTPRTGTVTLDPDEAMREAIVARAKARAALKTATGGAGKTKDGTRRPAAGQHRRGRGRRAGGQGGRRGRRAVPHRGAVPGLRRPRPPSRTRSRPTPRCSRPSATARWSSARWTPAPTSRWPSRPARRRRTRRSACAGYRMDRRFPQLLDDQLEAIAQAAKATGAKVVGDGADGVHRARGEGVHRQVRAHGLPVGRDDGRGAGRRAARPAHDGDRRLRQHRHQRPDPVRDGHRPDGRRAGRAAGSRGSRPCST